MNTEEKLKKVKKLADTMYYAAQCLTTDASRLHKAMDEYHKFIIHECKEEPVSEDNNLRKASEEYLKVLSETPYNNTPITNAQTIVRELITFLDNPSKYNPNHIEEPVREDYKNALNSEAITFLQEQQIVPNFYADIIVKAVKHGAKWQKNHLWKPADGDYLPEYNREVIVLLYNGKVVFAHRPPEYWDGKDIVTGKVTRYYPKTYDKGGWNIPDVVYWLDVELPKEIEL